MSRTEMQDEIERVAIVGLAGRFPGARDVNEYWRNLRDGVESITSFTEEELLPYGIDPDLLKSSSYVKARGVLENPEWFDASFFGFTAREAEIIDPQLRFFLENSWEALENAGYDTDSYEGVVGIYGGMSAGQYILYNLLPNRELVSAVGAVQLRLLNDKDFLTPLVAYKLNLKGPTVNVQTACSTSLVAVHLACQSLLSYQCDLALAGGVSVQVPPKSGYVPVEGVFSPEGHCRAFDADARGTVSGSGVGCVVLKRLSEALSDGDTIHAVIRGSAINNDGASRVGYSAPSVDGQAEVIALAQAFAGVEPEMITYVEAHGTATPMGDSIEVAALTQVFSAATDRKEFCGLGSVKTNIGHADAAAGIASLIKTVMALKHRQLPPSLNFRQPNPEIDFPNTPFFVNDKLLDWKTDRVPLRAGISSFAMGGTNAHVIVEQAPEVEGNASGRSVQLVLLSAKNDSALEAATDNLAAYLKEQDGLDLADAAYTLALGRRAFKHRRAIVCSDMDDLANVLTTRDPQRILDGTHDLSARPVAFMFPGLGNHYVNMGWALYRDEAVFREQVDRCCELIKPHLGSDLRDVLFPEWRHASELRPRTVLDAGTGLDLRRMLRGAETEDEATRRLNQTVFAQPALFIIEYALAQLWMKWGIEPEALLGYSVGEYTAACLAGVYSLEDALMLVARRAQLIQELPAGAMLAVPLPANEVAPLLNDELDIAAINSPSVCIVSGKTTAIDELETSLRRNGLALRRLQTTHAFHSRLIAPIVESFTSLLRTIKLNAPNKRVLSNVTGDWLTAEQATDPQYWATHLCRPVLFGKGLERLWAEKGMVLLEVGPGQALGAWALQHPLSAQVEDRVVLSSLRHSYDNQSDLGFLLNTLGRLWLAGINPDWSAFYGEHRRRRVPLPSYPFERQRYWVEPQERKKDPPASGRVVSLLKKTDVAEWFYLPLWKQSPPHPAHMLAQFAEGSKCYLVFTDEDGVGARLAAELRTAKQEVVVVRAGEGFRKVDEYNFTIAPKQSGDYDTLIRELRSLGRQPQVICHLWSVTREHSLETSVDDVDEYQFAGFYSLLFLAQALGNRNIAGGLRLVVVTNAVQAVSGEEKLCPAKATVLGPCRVIPQEYPHITCQSIDITLPAPATPQADQLAFQLLLELAAETSEPLVAYRGPHRWLQTFAPVRLESAENRKTLLREGGVYLITGGLGGIGLTLAEYIARTVRARLVLIGRGTLPDATQWDAWLKAHDDSDLLSQKIRKVQALEKAGAEVLIASADVTSLQDMEKVIALTHTRFGKIDGLLHAAGVLPGGMMQLKQPEVAGSVLAPKVKGTLVLDAVLADEKLDFFACCSSLNAIYGGFGLVDHCGANAFLDAFAEAGPARGETHRLSINWDGWLEVGQAANAALSTGLRGILNAAHESEETHPLLDKLIVDEPEKEVHSTQLSTTRQWIVNEHRLMGNGVVPGTGYLEMVRAAFEKRAAGGTIELSKVFFLAPLIVRDGEVKETRTIFTKNKDAYDFSVVSLDDTEAEPLWREHVKGKINHSPLQNSPAQLMSELLARLKPEELTSMEATRRGSLPESDLEKGTNDFRPEDRNFGPRWQNLLQRVGMVDLEALAYLELPEEFAADLSQFQLHPSLMDAAVGFTQIAGDGFYLPLAYESIKVHAPLTQKLYSYAKFRNAGAGKNDLLVCDLMLLDEEGNRLVEIQEYTMRRINNLAALKGDAAQNSAATALGSNGSPAKAPESAAPANAQTTSIISEGILPAEGADAFGRLLSSGLQVPRVAVATRDLQGMIEQSRAMTGTRILEQVNKLQSAQQRHPRPNLPVAYVAPRSEVEERLSGIWQEVLGISEAGVYDNFFDLGGDSLLATLLIGRLGEAFNVDLSLRMIFEAPNVADMAITIVQEQAQQIDPDTLTELLATVKNLSTNEIVAALSPE